MKAIDLTDTELEYYLLAKLYQAFSTGGISERCQESVILDVVLQLKDLKETHDSRRRFNLAELDIEDLLQEARKRSSSQSQ